MKKQLSPVTILANVFRNGKPLTEFQAEVKELKAKLSETEYVGFVQECADYLGCEVKAA